MVLVSAGSDRLAVMMEIRRLRPDLGLKQAKAIVDNAPQVVKVDVRYLDRDQVRRGFVQVVLQDQ